MIRVVLADDHALIREGLRMLLELQDDMDVVGEAADGVEAVEVTRRTRPDVVLMDVQMPRVDGLAATEQLLAGAPPHPKVLVLTTYDLDEHVYRALKAGASGFLLKDAGRGQLLHAIRSVADGAELLSPAVTRRLIERFVRQPSPQSTLNRLTPRERDVLALAGRGLSNAEIAAALILSETTVKTHLAHVFAKYDLRDRAQAVVLAYESGLVRPGEAD